MECVLKSLVRIVDSANEYGVAITALATVLLTVVTALLVVMARRQITTSRAQLRAYVSVESSRIRAVIGEPLRAQINVKNYGQTPAYKFRMSGYMSIAQTFLAGSQPDGDAKHVTWGVLSPSAPFQLVLTSEQALGSEQLAALTEGRLTLFVHGEVIYEDAFRQPRNMRYRTMFGGPAGVKGGQLMSCPEGNDAN